MMRGHVGIGHVSTPRKKPKHFEIWGDDAVMEAMCVAHTPEDEAYLEARLQTVESIRGLLEERRWQGVMVFININVKDNRQFIIDICAATDHNLGVRGEEYFRLRLIPEPTHWQSELSLVDDRRGISKLTEAACVAPEDLKQVLGQFKAHMRMYK